ncbi:MAG: DsrE family protein [Ignavibacteriales bacterium]|nr:DsrE family protein [Ignavibacteriales bacterium]
MKLGIIIYSSNAEVVWNVFRLANLSLKDKDEVKVFLLANGVEAEQLDSEKYQIVKLMNEFVSNNGLIYACGTCLKIRNSEGTELCPLSTMKDLYDIINESDKIISF